MMSHITLLWFELLSETGDFKNGVKYIDQKAYELLGKSKLFGGEMIMNKIGSAR